MDFIRFIKSLEDFLYEVATWLLFYPRTLWLAFRRPMALAAYSERELSQDLREQYTDVVSPPLFLLLTLLLVHALEMLGPPGQTYRSPVIAKLMESDVNLLMFRAVAYSLFPLLMARTELSARGLRIDRNSLRRPFYDQCFFVAPLVVLSSIGTVAGRLAGNRYDLLLGLIAGLWYIVLETRWFHRKLAVSYGRAAWIALRTTLLASVLLFGIVCLVALPDVLAAAAE